jgi:hypothetical protein
VAKKKLLAQIEAGSSWLRERRCSIPTIAPPISRAKFDVRLTKKVWWQFTAGISAKNKSLEMNSKFEKASSVLDTKFGADSGTRDRKKFVAKKRFRARIEAGSCWLRERPCSLPTIVPPFAEPILTFVSQRKFGGNSRQAYRQRTKIWK